jgi:V8-like Glu-specific endopeptidase
VALEDRLVCSFVHVTHTQVFPASAVVHVDVVYDSNHNGIVDPNDVQAEASGVMVGPDTCLTSAHVVYDSTAGGLALKVTITPGENSSFHPFGTFAASSWVIPALYTDPTTSDGVDTAADIAVLNFQPINTSSGQTHIGDLTGWMTPRAFPDRTLNGLQVTNIGYPADTFSGTVPFRSSGPIMTSHQVGGVGYFSFSNISIPIQEGSSGSPLFRKLPGSGTVVVGLTEATIIGANLNLATKITARVKDFIAAAKQDTGTGGMILPFAFAQASSAPTAAVTAAFAEFAHQHSRP